MQVITLIEFGSKPEEAITKLGNKLDAENIKFAVKFVSISHSLAIDTTAESDRKYIATAVINTKFI